MCFCVPISKKRVKGDICPNRHGICIKLDQFEKKAELHNVKSISLKLRQLFHFRSRKTKMPTIN